MSQMISKHLHVALDGVDTISRDMISAYNFFTEPRKLDWNVILTVNILVWMTLYGAL